MTTSQDSFSNHDLDKEDPDVITASEATFAWDYDFQKHIIALLLTDRTFLLQSIDLIKPNYFTNKAHRRACEILFNFFAKYRTVPNKTILVQEISEELKDDKARLYYLAELNSIYDFFEPSVENRQYLSDKIAYFAKIQAIRLAFNKSMKLIDKDPESDDTWGKVYDFLRVAMNTDRNFDIGLEYFKTLKERYERMLPEDEDEEKFVTGYADIDEQIKGGGYKRGEMIAVVGGSGVGKSLWCTGVAATNITRGKKCLYLACGDANEDRVAERFDAVLSDLPVDALYDRRNEVFAKLEGVVGTRKDRNMLVVKYFPSTTADVNTLRAYMAQLKFYGFTPDLVVVDYVGEMRDFPDMPTYESRERIVKELRGLAGEEGVFLITAMQPNRGAKEAQKIGRIEEEHLADSFGQIRPLDALFSLNQNDDEKLASVGRLYVIKQRFGKTRYQVYVKFDQKTLRITQIYKDTYKTLRTTKQDQITESVEHDMIDKVVKPLDADAAQAALIAKKFKPSDAEESKE